MMKWWFKKKIQVRKWWRQILFVTGVVLAIVCVAGWTIHSENAEEAEIKAAADKLHEERWSQITGEAKICEPLFFVKKRLAAHKLWEITCVDENGKTSTRYIKGDHFQWHW